MNKQMNVENKQKMHQKRYFFPSNMPETGEQTTQVLLCEFREFGMEHIE